MTRSVPVHRVDAARARRASLAYHFRDGTVDDVFDRHASVQFDPLAPLGTNHDLVFAARVPGYRIGDWRDAVYGRSRAYDGWDKQASLVAIDGQPSRRRYHEWHGRRWMREVEERWSAQIDDVVGQLERRGPLEAGEVELDERIDAWEGSWYGPRLAKRILRALWHAGRIATADRRHGRHVYDLAERVLPAEVLARPTPAPDVAARRLIHDRHRATGLLRPSAASEVWSMPLPAEERRGAIAACVDEDRLVPVEVEGILHHAVPEWLDVLASGRTAEGVRFVAPLDPLLWDRGGVRRAFGFDYLWEVYKPADRRRWGWYVLPVVWRDRFVGRIEGARVERDDGEIVWRVDRWWWEEGPAAISDRQEGTSFLADLETAAARFARYLGASRCVIRGGVPRDVAAALRAGARRADPGAGTAR